MKLLHIIFGNAPYLWWYQCKVLRVVVSDGYIVHCEGQKAD